jgi:glutamate-1-semialdehyde 2,1-aminomutase
MPSTTSRKVEQSQRLQKRAESMIPGGVNSPVRAFRAVGCDPVFIVRGKGAHIWDADENEYIDYIGSWGPLILGHADQDVLDAILGAACNGTSFGASTPSEADLAELVISAFPQMQKVRFVSSGTEATMSAIRLARAYTKRKYIVKFEGCYHGHADALLVKAGSGVATLGIPGSAGVPEEFIQFTVALPFNNIQMVEHAFHKFKHQIACVIVEPVVGNMGCVPGADDFLVALRLITEREHSVLIFDEVMTGFRLAFGGAQEIYNVRAGSDDDGKNYWRRAAGGRLRRAERDYGSGGAAGADVPGGDAFGESSGNGGGMRDAETFARSQAGDLSAAGKVERRTGGGRGGGGKRGRSCVVPQSRGIDVYLVLYEGAGEGLG